MRYIMMFEIYSIMFLIERVGVTGREMIDVSCMYTLYS